MDFDIIVEKFMRAIFSVDFAGKEVLEKQYGMASAAVNVLDKSCISIKFKITEHVEKYRYTIRVPVEAYAYQKNCAPVVFLIHVIDGLIDELEIFSADSSPIELNTVELDNVEYAVNSELRQE